MDIRQAAEDNWLSPAQVARLLEVSTDRVRQLIKDGKLIAAKTVLGRLVDPASVETLREQRDHAQH
jgi:excisionase family DNA binding protein